MDEFCCTEGDYQFASETSCHGLPRFCNDWKWWRRVMWLLITLCALGFMTHQLIVRTQDFLKFDMSTTFELSPVNSLFLPAITLCNVNMFSRSLLTPMDKTLFQNISRPLSRDLLRIIAAIEESQWDEQVVDQAFSNWSQLVRKYWDAEEDILLSYGQDPDTFTVRGMVERTGWQIQPASLNNSGGTEMLSVILCTMNRVPCSFNDFKRIHTPAGLCYTLNNNRTKRSQKLSGVDKGFKLVINAAEWDYSTYGFSLETPTGAGLLVIAHEWYEYPDIGTAVALPTGSTGIIPLQKSIRRTVNEPPWGTCRSTQNFNKNIPYSRRNCIKSCDTKVTIQACGCRLWYEYFDAGNAAVNTSIQCGFAMTTACIWLKEIMSDDDLVDKDCINRCLDSCEETTYQYSASYTRLVSNSTFDSFQKMLIFLAEWFDMPMSQEFIDGYLTETYLKENVAEINIGYSQLQIDVTSSSPLQTPTGFLSDIGGQLGLFAGISVITICEFIEYPFIKFASFIKKRNNVNKQNHSNDDIVGDTKV